MNKYNNSNMINKIKLTFFSKSGLLLLSLLFFINYISAQQIVSKQLSFEEALKNEQALQSVKIVDENEDINDGDIIIYNNKNSTYPFGTLLNAPLEYSRTISDFHIKPQTAYYFDSQKKKLLFFEMNWNAKNNLNIFSRSFLSDLDKVLKEESTKKSLYKNFYNKLNKSVIAIFGEPSKRSRVKDWEAYNADGWRYEWTTDNYKITTELRIPKEGFVDLIYINYSIAWK